MRLLDYLTSVYARSRLQLSKGTRYQMELAVRRMESALGRQIAVEDLSEDVISDYLRHLIDDGDAPSQVKVRRGYMMCLWRKAYKKGYNTNNPFTAEVEMPRLPKLQPVAWSFVEIQRMLIQAAEVKPRGKMFFAGRHWWTLLMLIFYTGLRIGAVLQLRRTDLKGHVLFVPHGIQKDHEEMHISLPNNLVSSLVAIYRPRMVAKNGNQLDEMLIPWPWCLRWPQEKFTRHILKPAGLPIDRWHKFHALRKTVATAAMAMRGKLAAQQIMGHSSMSVTERYLADPSMVCPTLQGNPSPKDFMPNISNVI